MPQRKHQQLVLPLLLLPQLLLLLIALLVREGTEDYERWLLPQYAAAVGSNCVKASFKVRKTG